MKAIILSNKKTVKILEVANDKPEVTHSGGLYVMSPDAVNRAIWPTDPKKDHKIEAEIIFFENQSNPVDPGTGETQDTSKNYLGQYVIRNALEQTGLPRDFGAISSFIASIRRGLTIQNLILLIVFGSIALSIIRQYMGGA